MWGLVLMMWFSTMLGFFAHVNPLLGGVIGFEINDFLQDYLGFIGTLLLMIFVAVIYLVVRLNLTPEKVGSYISSTKKEVAKDFETAKNNRSAEKVPAEETLETPEESSVLVVEDKEEELESCKEEPVIEMEVQKQEKLIIRSDEEEDRSEERRVGKE